MQYADAVPDDLYSFLNIHNGVRPRGVERLSARSDGKERTVVSVPIEVTTRYYLSEYGTGFLRTEVGYALQSIRKYDSRGGASFGAGFGFGRDKKAGYVGYRQPLINIRNEKNRRLSMLQFGLEWFLN